MSEQRDYQAEADERDRKLIEAGYSEVKHFGGTFGFGPTATSCARCGALILLGEGMECDGMQIEKNLHAHALWHAKQNVAEESS